MIVPTLPSVDKNTVGVIGQLGLFNGSLYVCLGTNKFDPNFYIWSQVNGGGVLVETRPKPKPVVLEAELREPTQELADQAP